MEFTEKLRRLAENKNTAELCRAVGLNPTAISDYISKGYTPRADIALKFAKALNVPLEWLVDDHLGFPAPQQGPTLDLCTDDQLMNEVSLRYARLAVEMLDKLPDLEAVDWKKSYADLLAASERARSMDGEQAMLMTPDRGEPVEIRNHVALASLFIYAESRLKSFDGSERFFSWFGKGIFGRHRPEELTPAAIQRRLKAFTDKHPEFAAFQQALLHRHYNDAADALTSVFNARTPQERSAAVAKAKKRLGRKSPEK